jgi:deoxycytidylate deaminase
MNITILKEFTGNIINRMHTTPIITYKQAKECKDKQEFFLSRAAYSALRSNVKHHKHGCVIVKDGKIIAEGYNHYINHFEHTFTIHAEVDAIIKMKKINKKITGCELYVVRIGTDNMGNPLKYSRPCTNCINAILKSGIKNVYFSTDDEFNKVFKEFINPTNNTRYNESYSRQIAYENRNKYN